jgi:hypothetical protein
MDLSSDVFIGNVDQCGPCLIVGVVSLRVPGKALRLIGCGGAVDAQLRLCVRACPYARCGISYGITCVALVVCVSDVDLFESALGRLRELI